MIKATRCGTDACRISLNKSQPGDSEFDFIQSDSATRVLDSMSPSKGNQGTTRGKEKIF